MALLAIPSAYLAHDAKIVASRKAWLTAHSAEGWVVKGTPSIHPEKGPSVLRRLLGDEDYNWIYVFSADDIPAAEKLFPEAQVSINPILTD